MGSILGATPKMQQIAHIIGVIIPAFVIAPVLSLLHHAYGIGTGLKVHKQRFLQVSPRRFSEMEACRFAWFLSAWG